MVITRLLPVYYCLLLFIVNTTKEHKKLKYRRVHLKTRTLDLQKTILGYINLWKEIPIALLC